jgi:hypothetical protein
MAKDPNTGTKTMNKKDKKKSKKETKSEAKKAKKNAKVEANMLKKLTPAELEARRQERDETNRCLMEEQYAASVIQSFVRGCQFRRFFGAQSLPAFFALAMCHACQRISACN